MLLLPMLACDELQDLADGKFDIITTAEVLIDIQSDTKPNPEDDVTIPSNAETYNFSFDPDIMDLVGTDLSVIKEVKILEVTYEYLDFSGNADAILTSTVRFSGGVNYTSEPTKVSEAALLTERFGIESDFQPLNEFIAFWKFFGVEYSATSTDNPVEFDVLVTVRMELTIDEGEGNSQGI